MVQESKMPLSVAIGPSSFADQNDAPLRALKEAGISIIPNPYGRRLTEDETISLLQNADALLAGLEPLNRHVLSSAPHLKAIARVGIGMDNVDQQRANELGIKVSNTPEWPTAAVAEMTLAAMLTLTRNLISSDKAMHAGDWKKIISPGLSENTVLLIGFGRIGKRVAELLRPLRVNIMVFDPLLPADEIPAGVRAVSLSEGLAQANVVSLHAAGSDTLLGEAEFAVMKKDTILLNSARGTLVNETALCDALDAGIISSAWFDVFWQEPYAGSLMNYPQVLMTPHISTYTQRCRVEMETAAVRNILHDLNIQLMQ